MKKVAFGFGLAVIVVAFVLGAFAKNKDGRKSNASRTVAERSGLAWDKGLLLAKVDPDSVHIDSLFYDENVFVAQMLSRDVFDSVESAKMSRARDAATGEFVTYFTMIGSKAGKAIAFQIALNVDKAGNATIPAPVNDEMVSLGITHSCSGIDCSNCAFVIDDNGTITGCVYNGSNAGHCDHTITATQGSTFDFLRIFVKPQK